MYKIYYISDPSTLTPQFLDILLFTMSSAYCICKPPTTER